MYLHLVCIAHVALCDIRICITMNEPHFPVIAYEQSETMEVLLRRMQNAEIVEIGEMPAFSVSHAVCIRTLRG